MLHENSFLLRERVNFSKKRQLMHFLDFTLKIGAPTWQKRVVPCFCTHLDNRIVGFICMVLSNALCIELCKIC